MLIKTGRRQHAWVISADNLLPPLTSPSYQKHQPGKDECRYCIPIWLLSTMDKFANGRIQVTFLTPLSDRGMQRCKGSCNGCVLTVHGGSEKKPDTTQASSSGTKDGCAINQERKAELLPAEPEPPHHTPFQLGFHFPDISCLNISCLYRLKEWSCGISNIAFLLDTYLSPAKSFLITWKLTHLSKSQILRGEVCPQQAVPVTNELFKNKTNKNTY